jgi:hypothetical protein
MGEQTRTVTVEPDYAAVWAFWRHYLAGLMAENGQREGDRRECEADLDEVVKAWAYSRGAVFPQG